MQLRLVHDQQHRRGTFLVCCDLPHDAKLARLRWRTARRASAGALTTDRPGGVRKGGWP